MRTTTVGAALLLLGAQHCAATTGHREMHRQFEKRHGHGHLPSRSFEAELRSPESDEAGNTSEVRKRGSGCSLPGDDGNLVRISDTRNDNQGFAMSPDQPCQDGMYCPFACKPGMLMNQWKDGTSFKPVESMQGGLYCDNGTPKKPFPNKPNCVDGTGTVKAVNKCGKPVAFCQTVLPGNEAMLIPTEVSGTTTLAVPGPDYWAGTAAHYYVNPPGVSINEACRWGSDANDVGNWSPFVAGANTVSNGNTFVQLSWNPIYEASKWANKVPNFGMRIECEGGQCNGLPCEIDPSKTGLKNVNSANSAVGAGGASFCVVTVPKGASAKIIVFNTDGSTGDSPSTTKEETKPTTTATATSSPDKTTTSSSDESSSSSSSSAFVVPSVRPGIFQENSTSTTDTSSQSDSSSKTSPDSTKGGSSTSAAASPSSTNDGTQRDKGGAAVVGLVIAIIAAAWMY